jgi:hypothetical protein
MILSGGCSLHSWSKGQSVTAKSSAESEFYSICLCTDEALGWQSLLLSIGLNARISVMTDSSAALAQCCRLGAGAAMKHVQTRFFWIQEVLASRKMTLSKTAGVSNVADLMTKSVTAKVLKALREPAGLYDLDEYSVASIAAGTSRSSSTSPRSSSYTEQLGAHLTALIMLLQSATAQGARPSDSVTPSSNLTCVPTSLWYATAFFAFVGLCCSCFGLRELVLRFRRRRPDRREPEDEPGPSVPLIAERVASSSAAAARITPFTPVRLAPTVIWVAPTGSKWHFDEACSGMSRSKSVRRLTNCFSCACALDPGQMSEFPAGPNATRDPELQPRGRANI